ncbi:XtrA/YqaO family protein [Enterococcus casseliflavus]|uniref:XtrA/YqaO family protein n=1 Tax=Enterococcus casseliflavus TaxID=37734 RepID=UPI0021AB17F0|nr:XtrA/YqaO family protein [Enterococcus casseliflavus]
MESKEITDIDLSNEKIISSHFVAIVSDGKMKMIELPDYGEIQIICKDGKVKRVKENTEELF